MFETFDHTADLGLRIRAPDLNALFAEAGEALFAAVVEDLSAVRPDRPVGEKMTVDAKLIHPVPTGPTLYCPYCTQR